MDTTENMVDEIKLRRMQQRIYLLEKQNMANNEKTESQMIDAIKKIIEMEAKKCY